MTKLTLEMDMDMMEEEFFDETALIGIVTAMPGYQLCWTLNEYFEINFLRDPSQDIQMKRKTKDFLFPIYQHDLPNSTQKYVLYKLKDAAEPLLPETRQLDYLWLIQTTHPEKDAQRITTGLRNINNLQMAHVLDAAQLKKSLKNLLV